MEQREDLIWNTEALVLFGMWLLKKEQTGYGLLCIHAPILGVKIGNLLKLKWTDFIDPYTNTCEAAVYIEDDKLGSRELSEFIQKITTFVYQKGQEAKNVNLDDYIFTNPKTGKVLTTSTLRRELSKLYEDFKVDIRHKTFLEWRFRPIETNTFEIAWARDMVSLYYFSKKAFIAVSKFLGHRTVAHTINYLELECIDEVKLRFDLYSPNNESPYMMFYSLDDNRWLTNYLIGKKFGRTTPEYFVQRRQHEADRAALNLDSVRKDK